MCVGGGSVEQRVRGTEDEMGADVASKWIAAYELLQMTPKSRANPKDNPKKVSTLFWSQINI